ncbi:hypothetical protein VNO77_08184 [Canavalia gladiata]|uniref:Uncharacterized protein n=1 Tax=Canavalia gladiata TaxID=3824 RepID=A0AAN9M948_CANGL
MIYSDPQIVFQISFKNLSHESIKLIKALSQPLDLPEEFKKIYKKGFFPTGPPWTPPLESDVLSFAWRLSEVRAVLASPLTTEVTEPDPSPTVRDVGFVSSRRSQPYFNGEFSDRLGFSILSSGDPISSTSGRSFPGVSSGYCAQGEQSPEDEEDPWLLLARPSATEPPKISTPTMLASIQAFELVTVTVKQTCDRRLVVLGPPIIPYSEA